MLCISMGCKKSLLFSFALQNSTDISFSTGASRDLILPVCDWWSPAYQPKRDGFVYLKLIGLLLVLYFSLS